MLDLDGIIARVYRERCDPDERERDADRQLASESATTGSSSWRYLDPEVETLRTITAELWFLAE